MMNATREKTRLWLLILIGVVATLLGQTHAREIFAPSPHESGVFAAQTQASTGENYDACRYDAPDSLLAAKSEGYMIGEILPNGRIAGDGPGATIRSDLLGNKYPTKLNRGGSPQPFDPSTGRYLPYTANSGLTMSPIGRFSAGFSQGMAEAQGAIGATPVGKAGNLGHMIGQILGNLIN